MHYLVCLLSNPSSLFTGRKAKGIVIGEVVESLVSSSRISISKGMYWIVLFIGGLFRRRVSGYSHHGGNFSAMVENH